MISKGLSNFLEGGSPILRPLVNYIQKVINEYWKILDKSKVNLL